MKEKRLAEKIDMRKLQEVLKKLSFASYNNNNNDNGNNNNKLKIEWCTGSFITLKFLRVYEYFISSELTFYVIYIFINFYLFQYQRNMLLFPFSRPLFLLP